MFGTIIAQEIIIRIYYASECSLGASSDGIMLLH